ncbi:hypothetical protein GLP27_06250 [Photobacterium carnosum]|nr:hypothetical protein [Photobacterium carnosum]
MRKKLLSMAILLTASSSLFAAEMYDPNKNYSTKEQVQFNGHIFEAQWWVKAILTVITAPSILLIHVLQQKQNTRY